MEKTIKFLAIFTLILFLATSVTAVQGQGNGNQVTSQNKIVVNNVGQEVEVQIQTGTRTRLRAGDIEAETDLEIEEETEETTNNGVRNQTKLHVTLSNGRKAEIKVMPETASERALERLRLKVCSAENNCSIELKEVGKTEEEKQLAYELQIERHSRILGIFQKKMQVQAEINAENGEVIRVRKPWWAFLATEPAEE